MCCGPIAPRRWPPPSEGPFALFAERLARRGQGLGQHGGIADVVCQQQDEAGVEGGALGLGKAGVGLQYGGVEAVRIGDVGVALERHGAPSGPWWGSRVAKAQRRGHCQSADIVSRETIQRSVLTL